MPVEVVVPQIGEAIAELTITAWLKQPGDEVKKGDVLFEVDSDKAIVEIESFVDGVLTEIIHPENSSVLPQQVVALIRTPDEASDGDDVGAADALDSPPIEHQETNSMAGQRDVKTASSISPLAQRIADDLQINLAQVKGTGPRGRIQAEDVRLFAQEQSQLIATAPDGNARVLAYPRAKQRARELNIDLNGIMGTGVDSIICVADVERAAQAAATNRVAVTRLRQTIAARTLESKREIPHFYLMVNVNMIHVRQLRDYCQNALHWERKPTFTDIIVRACALSLAEMPHLNRSYSADGMIQHDTVNIGIAVNTDEGLVVPVLPRADELSLRQTSSELNGVVLRAREGRLRPADVSGKSMVVSNLGMYGVDAFVAIIDLPDPMILAVGRTSDRVIPIAGEISIQPMCTLTLSVDHRAMDGVQGAQFLDRVKSRLEHPFDILG